MKDCAPSEPDMAATHKDSGRLVFPKKKAYLTEKVGILFGCEII